MVYKAYIKKYEYGHITSLLNPIRGASAGKNTIKKLSTQLSIILKGINLETTPFIEPSPIILRKMDKNFEKILNKYFGMFLAKFFVLTFILSNSPFRSYMTSRTSGGLYKLISL